MVITYPKLNKTNWALAAIAVVIIMAVAGFIYVQQNFRKQLIQVTQTWNLILYLMVAVFVPFINATHLFEVLILTAVPLSAFNKCGILYPQKKWQLVHWIMVGFVIVISYFIRVN